MNSKINKIKAQSELRKRKECAKVQPVTTQKAQMQISKRTLPTVRGGLLNKDFVYVNAANTDVSKTFTKARLAIEKTTRVLEDLSATIGWTPMNGQYMRGCK